MSTGSIKDREINSKEDFVQKGSLDTAKTWCEECRKILGLGLAGEAKRMEQAVSGISKQLDKLNGIAAYGEGLEEKLEGFENEFKEAAYELEVLRAQYRELEALKKKASFLSSEEKNAKKNMDKKEQEIKNSIANLESLQTRSQKVVDDEKQRQKQVRDQIRSKPDGKQIVKTRESFGKELVKLRKISEFFAKNYDATTASDIAGAFEVLSQFNWLKIDTLVEAQFELTQIQQTILAWQATQKEFVEGKSKFQSSRKQAQTLMQRAEIALPPQDLVSGNPSSPGFLDRFSLGEQSALVKNWKLAGANVNSDFITQLDKKVKEAEGMYFVWEKIKMQSYVDIKASLEKLSLKQYQIVGLQKIADAVAIGDKGRDFVGAVNAFNLAETQAKQYVAAESHFLSKDLELGKEASRVTVLANQVTGDAQKFACGFQDLIYYLRARFKQELVLDPFAKNEVPTIQTIDALLLELKLAISEIDKKISDLSNPTKLQELTDEMASKKDIGPFVLDLKKSAEHATSSVDGYAGLRFDPVGDPSKIATWNEKITGAKTWIERRERDLAGEEAIVFDDAMKNHAMLKMGLETVIREAEQATTGSGQEIETARTELETQLNVLKKWLTAARLTTVREETWHAAAILEVEQIESILKTDNKTALLEKTTRVIELQGQCKNVVKDTSLGILIPQDDVMTYNALKELFDELIKKVKGKEVKSVLRALSERYAGKGGILVLALADLRNDGAGSMAVKKDKWTTRYRELKAEVETNVLGIYESLVKARKICEEKIKSLRDRINKELCNAIQKATGGKEVVLGANLPLMGKVNEAQGNLITADTKDRYDQVIKQLENINEEVTWALEDIAGGDVQRFVTDNSNAEEIKRQQIEQNLKLKAQYDLSKVAFQEARNKAKSSPNVDQQEFTRYVDLYKQAEKSFKKGTFGDAAKKMELVCRLMKLLADNPLGSQVTGRGQEHLKELNVRWGNAIETLNKSIGGLGDAIFDSCKVATEELDETQSGAILKKFDSKVSVPIKSELDPGAFQRELLVLQGAVPSKKEDRNKDEANKKKYREQALAKVRNYQRLLQKHPMYQTVMFQSNPWRKSNGTVNALDLMRAINDIDLNVQRGVG